jgi:hypothetical protein
MKQLSRNQMLKKSLLFVLPFQIVSLLIGIVAALSGAEDMTIGLLLVIVVTLWAPAALAWVTRVELPFALQVNYFVFIILSSLAGSGLGAYAWIPNWDTYVHAYSGVFLAWLGFFAVQQAEVSMKATAPKWLTIVMGIATALAFAALWEMGEYWSDTTLGTTTQAGLQDTIVDMVAALIGATLAIILTWAKLPASVLPHAFLGKKK